MLLSTFKYSFPFLFLLSLAHPQKTTHPFCAKMKSFASFFLLALLLVACSLSVATQPDPDQDQFTKGKPTNHNNRAGGNDGGMGGFFGPGPGFGIPGTGFGIPGAGFGKGWGDMGGGYGAGFGGPKGGYSKGGIVRPSVVCRERGPCYKKKLTCPAKCFTSHSRSGKGYGGGGGGGGCTLDCKKCVAYC